MTAPISASRGSPVVARTQRFDQALDGHRCVGLELPEARGAGGAHRVEQGRRGRELGEHAVCASPWIHGAPRSWVSNSRISAMEITGTKRTNSNSSQPKKPIEPMRIAQSQNVG